MVSSGDGCNIQIVVKPIYKFVTETIYSIYMHSSILTSVGSKIGLVHEVTREGFLSPTTLWTRLTIDLPDVKIDL